MEFRHLFLPAVVAPAAAALATLAAAWAVRAARSMGRRGTRGIAPEAGLADGAGVAVAAAVVASFVAMTGWPSWPPIDSTQRLLYVVVVAGLSTLIPRLRGAVGWPWLWRGALLAVGLVLVLKTPLQHTWSTGQAALWLTGLLVIAVAVTAALTRAFERASARQATAAATRIAIPATAALVLGLSASARLAFLAAALATAIALVESLAYARARRPWRSDQALPVAATLLGLLLAGSFYAQVGPWPAALIVLAVLLLPGSSTAWARWLPILALTLAAAIVVVGHLTAAEDPYDYSSRAVAGESSFRV